MTGLLFADPQWLAPGLVAVAGIAGAVFWAASRSGRDLQRLLGPAARSPALARPRRLARARDVVLLLALSGVLAGLLGPRLGRENVPLSTGGVDVVLVLDTSRSMDAPDVPPSRLEAARRAAISLLAGLAPGDRAALSVFAGRGVLLTPLTPDHAALIEMVTAIETTLVKPGGSNLPAAITSAIPAFEPVDERPRTIFLLTDGESPGHPVETGLVAAVRENVRVVPVAFGTSEGATIPDHGVPLRDAQGEIVTTHRRLSALEAIADATDGRVFVTDEWGAFDVEAALRDLHAPVAAGPGQFVDHRVIVPVVVPFAAAALALLLLDWLVQGAPGLPRGSARRAVLARGRWPRPAALVTACAMCLAASPDATEDVPVPAAETLLRTGLDYAGEDSWELARAAFRAAAIAARDPELRWIAYHDLGVAALRTRNLEGAREAFLDALATADPEIDSDRIARTQWNLEWTQARLAEADAAEPEAPDPEKGDERERNEEKPKRESPEVGPDPREPAPTPEAPMPPDEEKGRHPADSRPLPASLPDLDAEERASWLARVEDDPRRALLSAAFESWDERQRRERGRPTW